MRKINSASFRDPSGFVFEDKGKIYRQINEIYKDDYELLMKSGLYKELIREELLIPHKEIKSNETGIYKIIQPKYLCFISYPYEWCFSQLKDAALLTLRIQKIAMKHGMSLKDASAYNVQFDEGKPVFIDTLSFEKYEEGRPWVPYKQFCQFFVAPLALMSYKNVDLGKLLTNYIDGIPLDLANDLLPLKSKLNFSIFSHIYLHSRAQKTHAKDGISRKENSIKISKQSLLAIIYSLENTVKNLKIKKIETEWGDYYSFTNYNKTSFNNKKVVIEKYLKKIKPKSVWDLGANNGEFSRIASNLNIPTVAFDIDPKAVEINYRITKQKNEKFMLPLRIDLTNPSSAIGWANDERKTLAERGPVDLVMALALIHHLAISNNLPFAKIAKYFSTLGKYLVIEFVPKEDSKVKILLSTRIDIFSEYDQKSFEKEFSKYFKILDKNNLKNSKRVLYLMNKI